MKLEALYEQAAKVINKADALLIGAGAGMGVDSGLPDFRGNDGFWKAYPPFRGKSFVQMANPAWFARDPQVAWGFYGHRLQLYQATQPHAGYALLRNWSNGVPAGSFVFTSNVDGHFQKAGFPLDRVVECHGSIHHLQCTRPCSDSLWPADEITLDIDPGTFRASPPLPQCPRCGSVARPNVLMFGDYHWVSVRSQEQFRWYRRWLQALNGKRLVVIECGAGTAVATVRHECERWPFVIRINPREAEVRQGISLPVGALEGLQGIQRYFD
jgi:NAD-dependent SIR2 family protein deacetylase